MLQTQERGTKLTAAIFTDAIDGPRRLPYEIDFDFAAVGDAGEAVADLLHDEAACG